jgi:hypothetical protein
VRAGQQARPRATYTAGSGRANGRAWAEHVCVGPWGSRVGGAGGASRCWDHILQMARHKAAGQLDSIGNGGTDFIVISAAPPVNDLAVRRADGSTARASVVPAAGARFCVFASVTDNRAIRWTAYSAAGTRLASGPVPASCPAGRPGKSCTTLGQGNTPRIRRGSDTHAYPDVLLRMRIHRRSD